MKDWLQQLPNLVDIEKAWITFWAFCGAVVSLRNSPGLTRTQRLWNTVAGFLLACLTGYVAVEDNWKIWISYGVAYLVGIVGSSITNAVQVAAQSAESDPFAFVRQVMNLIWSWKSGNGEKTTKKDAE